METGSTKMLDPPVLPVPRPKTDPVRIHIRWKKRWEHVERQTKMRYILDMVHYCILSWYNKYNMINDDKCITWLCIPLVHAAMCPRQTWAKCRICKCKGSCNRQHVTACRKEIFTVLEMQSWPPSLPPPTTWFHIRSSAIDHTYLRHVWHILFINICNISFKNI